MLGVAVAPLDRVPPRGAGVSATHWPDSETWPDLAEPLWRCDAVPLVTPRCLFSLQFIGGGNRRAACSRAAISWTLLPGPENCLLPRSDGLADERSDAW